MILKWMVQHNLRDIQVVGKILREYYLNPETVVKVAADKKANPKLILEKK